MAMSREQQREASRRIMEKNPLTEEDKEILRYNPSPAQWTVAYNQIQEAKERAKEKTKD